MNIAKEAKPTNSPATLVKATCRWTNIRMSTSGLATFSSTTTQTTAITTEPMKQPITLSEDQPQVWPCEMASSSRTRKAARVPAPRKSIRPPLRWPPSGTTKKTATRASTETAVENQKTEW